jgi:hypothetical protein
MAHAHQRPSHHTVLAGHCFYLVLVAQRLTASLQSSYFTHVLRSTYVCKRVTVTLIEQKSTRLDVWFIPLTAFVSILILQYSIPSII